MYTYTLGCVILAFLDAQSFYLEGKMACLYFAHPTQCYGVSRVHIVAWNCHAVQQWASVELKMFRRVES